MNNISSINFQGFKTQEQPKAKTRKNILGGALAVGAGFATKELGTRAFAPKILENVMNGSRNLSGDEITLAQQGVKTVFEKITNLAQKGVELNDYRKIPDAAWQIAKPKNFKEGFKLGLLTEFRNKYAYTTKEGYNAFFVGKMKPWAKEMYEKIGMRPNSINVNLEKLPLASFHEMGHAYNFNNSAIWKTIQKTRGISIIAPLIALIPAVTKEIKPQNGQELTAKEKRHNNLRKAAPFVAGLACVPMVMEETMATLRANKWAKQAFEKTPEMAKKIIKSNRWGIASYVLSAGLTVAMGLVAKKVKDASDEKIAFKNNNHLMKENNYHQG